MSTALNLNDAPAHAELRAGVRDALHAALPAHWSGLGALSEPERDEFQSWWRNWLRERGWLTPHWPVELGGAGLDPVGSVIVAEECVRLGLSHMPWENDPFSFHLLGQTLLVWGTPEQQQRFLPPTVDGTIRWAQGFSEPEAGSDLFALTTRASRDGDEWVINGQKTWQTAGTTADWLFALVRTDPTASRAAGLSFLLIDLDQPGVEVRGIENMAGRTDFAEVFFTDARTSVDNVVGGVGNGAKVALTLLGFERSASAVPTALAYEIELRRLAELADKRGLAGSESVRRRLAQCWSTVHSLRCIGYRVLTSAAAGQNPGPESSIVKLLQSEYHQYVTELAMEILGDEVLAPTGDDAFLAIEPQPLGLDPLSSKAWVTDYLQARPGTVYGGAAEVQRNTIAEQVLGMPREPRPAAPKPDRARTSEGN